MKILPHLHSCLVEIITTATLRFGQMGLLDNNSYWNKQGARTDFVLSAAENRPAIDRTLELMHSYRQFTGKEMQQIQEEIETTISKAQGGPMPVGKL